MNSKQSLIALLEEAHRSVRAIYKCIHHGHPSSSDEGAEEDYMAFHAETAKDALEQALTLSRAHATPDRSLIDRLYNALKFSNSMIELLAKIEVETRVSRTPLRGRVSMIEDNATGVSFAYHGAKATMKAVEEYRAAKAERVIAALPQDRVEAVITAMKEAYFEWARYRDVNDAEMGSSWLPVAQAAIAADEAWQRTNCVGKPIQVFGLSVHDIARLKDWFENRTGKNISDFWQEAFNAGVKTAGVVLGDKESEMPDYDTAHGHDWHDPYCVHGNMPDEQCPLCLRSLTHAGDASAETVEIRPPAPAPLSPEMREKVVGAIRQSTAYLRSLPRDGIYTSEAWQFAVELDAALAAIEPYGAAWRAGE